MRTQSQTLATVILAAVVLMALACTPATPTPTPTPTPSPTPTATPTATATATPTPPSRATATPTSIPWLPPAGIDTPEKLRAYLATIPDRLKIVVDSDTFAEIYDPWTGADYVGAMRYVHIPSMSQVAFTPKGLTRTYDEYRRYYKSVEGERRLEEVIADGDLKARVIDRIAEVRKLIWDMYGNGIPLDDAVEVMTASIEHWFAYRESYGVSGERCVLLLPEWGRYSDPARVPERLQDALAERLRQNVAQLVDMVDSPLPTVTMGRCPEGAIVLAPSFVLVHSFDQTDKIEVSVTFYIGIEGTEDWRYKFEQQAEGWRLKEATLLGAGSGWPY